MRGPQRHTASSHLLGVLLVVAVVALYVFVLSRGAVL